MNSYFSFQQFFVTMCSMKDIKIIFLEFSVHRKMSQNRFFLIYKEAFDKNLTIYFPEPPWRTNSAYLECKSVESTTHFHKLKDNQINLILISYMNKYFIIKRYFCFYTFFLFFYWIAFFMNHVLPLPYIESISLLF